MIYDIFYISLLVFAILAIQTGVLRNSVIYLAVFSFLCSFVYLLYGAPDVAIAEAVIGSTLSTILYLVALKKYKIFTVYYNRIAYDFEDVPALNREKEEIKLLFRKFASKSELQLDMINTSSSFKELMASASFDVIIIHTNLGIWVHGTQNNYHYEELMKELKEQTSLPIHLHYIHEEVPWTKELR